MYKRIKFCLPNKDKTYILRSDYPLDDKQMIMVNGTNCNYVNKFSKGDKFTINSSASDTYIVNLRAGKSHQIICRLYSQDREKRLIQNITEHKLLIDLLDYKNADCIYSTATHYPKNKEEIESVAEKWSLYDGLSYSYKIRRPRVVASLQDLEENLRITVPVNILIFQSGDQLSNMSFVTKV